VGPFLAGGLDKFFNILTDRGMYLSPAVGGVEIPHYVGQEDLAEVIGASREVASSLLNRLRKLRLVEYRRKGNASFALPHYWTTWSVWSVRGAIRSAAEVFVSCITFRDSSISYHFEPKSKSFRRRLR
jgi:DNA-binding IscR family transcriptional regulator